MATSPHEDRRDAHAGHDRDTLAFASAVTVDAFGISDPGNVRPANEDHFLIARAGRYYETVSTSLPEGELPLRASDDGYALVVADGMGGHAAGEVASRLTIRELVRLSLELPGWISRVDEGTIDEIVRRSEHQMASAHRRLIDAGRCDPDLQGMGTTVTAVRNLGRLLQVVHVGDSRAYLLRGDNLSRLTRDHSLVQMLVDKGRMTREEAEQSTSRHVLVNAVGGVNDTVRVDIDHVGLANGDRLLLCSDGLNDMVGDEAIRAELMSAATAEAACRALLRRALAAGGRDNITVVAAFYSWEGSAGG